MRNLETLTQRLIGDVEADEGFGEADEGFVDVVAAFPADA